MSRNDAHLLPKIEDESGPAETPFASLSKTLEDLEARLTRLSGAKPLTAEKSEPAKVGSPVSESSPVPAAPGERLRAMTAARRGPRPDLAAAVSAMTVDRQLSRDPVSDRPAPRSRPAPRPASSPVERRFGTIAGEVEALQMQGATFALIKDLANELTELRGDIQGKLGQDLEPRFEELRSSFSDLKQMISDRRAPDEIGAEIYEIMEALTELTAGNADQGSIDALRIELDSVAAMVGQLAREESLEAVQSRWDDFETRISDRIELDLQAKRDLRVELERLRGSLRSLATEEQILAVQHRWEEFESRYVDTARIQTEETLTRFLRDELDGLRTKLDLVVSQSTDEAFAARLDAMADRFPTGELEAGVERLSVRMGEIELALVGLPEILQIDQMEQSIQALADGIQGLAKEIREPDLGHFAVIEERLDEISAAIVAATMNRQVELDMAPIERIEARVAELAARVDRLVESGEADVLSVQIAALSERIEDLYTKPESQDLGGRIDSLSERVETLFRSAGSPDATIAFEARLTSLAQRLEESAASKSVDNEVVQALEGQIGRLADQLAGAPIMFGDEGPDVSRRLEAIERQLDENRDSVLVAARTAADEAVRRMQDEDVRRESGYVRELAQDLRNLETLCRESDERTFGVFDAVHMTLLKIVERLTAIEHEIRAEAAGNRPATQSEVLDAGDADRIEWAAARVTAAADDEAEPKGLRAAIARHMARRSGRNSAAALETSETLTLEERVRPTSPVIEQPSKEEPASFVFDAPGLDAADSMVSREANRPLEPGSGAPDIAALIERVRMQQRGIEPTSSEPLAKADFIAAARKAAMAAAAEAEALRDKAKEEPQDASGKDQAGRRRKPILMAVGAVLLALMAMPLGRAYLGPDADEPEASRTAALEAPASTEAPVSGPAMPTKTMAQTPENEPSQAPVLSVPEAEALVSPVDPSPPAVAAENPQVPNPPMAMAEPTPPVADTTTVEAAQNITPPVEPAPETTPAVTEEVTDSATLLASAENRLPASARGAVPAVPTKIGPPALVTAAESAEPMALFEVGLRLMEGRSAAPDPVAAMTWFAQSASRGFAPAQYSVGTLYEKGNGIARDTGAARDWYRLAADQGNIRAMHNLAVLYATGIEGRSDPEAAAEWFLKAAEHGMRDSQYNLGILYARGAGVDQDLSASYRWFSVVGQAGDKDAQTKMEEVGKTLAPDIRQRIDAEIAAWKPTPRIEQANTVETPASWAEKSGQTASVDMTRAIRNVQAILLKLGYNPGTPDGVVGEQTQTAIRQFQEKTGLQATGQIDEPLIRALLDRKDA